MGFEVERCTEETAPDSNTVIGITSLIFSLMLIGPKKVFKPLDLGIGRLYPLNPAKQA
jgi:hypothetical protein